MEKLGIEDEQLIRTYGLAYQKRLEKTHFSPSGCTASIYSSVNHYREYSSKCEKEHIQVPVYCADSLYQVAHLQVTVNGVPVPQAQLPDLSQLQAKTWEGNLDISLSAGKNTIQVMVRNEKGITSLEQTFTTYYYAPSTKPDLYLVTIGVSDYQQQQYSLKYASKDAADIQKLFRENVRQYKQISPGSF
jgi:hypothetical protein